MSRDPDNSHGGSQDGGTALRSRGPELAVAAVLLGLAGLVIVDSLRVGTGWADDGPKAGYFPFYIGLLLAASSGWLLVGQLLRWRASTEVFAQRAQITLVVAVFVPMVVYVGLIFALGIYAASALLIGYFMKRYGKYRWGRTALVSVGVPLVFYAVFERWFLVPLPKGPIAQLLGF
jgi:putative tricarboxylic transport membrane protein